ncbi:MAG TPA: CPBP family intramembrane glutamic endopeptidase [Nitrospira sp.]
MPPESGYPPPRTQPEWGAALVLLPIAATFDYYALPQWLQEQRLVQFAPQLIAYVAFGLWATRNDAICSRLGLQKHTLVRGMQIGGLVGILLGCVNSLMILLVVPSFGYDITFLRETPHAQLPVFVMVPWFIFGIALFVEVNFRGFLLGRLMSLESTLWKPGSAKRLSPLALLASALVFSLDPFMVTTFQHLHWIALWDGLIWGWILIRTGNLYATIIAHAIEVILMYSAVRISLM